MILGRFPASDDTGHVAPASVFARVAVLEAEVERLRRIETAARAYRGPGSWGRERERLRAELDAALEGRA